MHTRAAAPSVYIVPVDPTAARSPSDVDGLDVTKLWAALPHGAKPDKAGTAHVFFDTPAGAGGARAKISSSSEVRSALNIAYQ